MKNNKQKKMTNFFEKFATAVTRAAGSTPAFIIAFLIIVAWAIAGPFLIILKHGNW